VFRKTVLKMFFRKCDLNKPCPQQFQQNLKLLSVSQYLQEVPRSSSYEHDVVEPMSGMLTIINSRLMSAQNDISQNENILLPHNWNYRGLSLSLSEKNAFYNCIGYILKSLTNTGLRCKKCINSLGSKTETMNEFSRYTILKQYKKNLLFFYLRKISIYVCTWKKFLEI
jgi:hypothetical protein